MVSKDPNLEVTGQTKFADSKWVASSRWSFRPISAWRRRHQEDAPHFIHLRMPIHTSLTLLTNLPNSGQVRAGQILTKVAVKVVVIWKALSNIVQTNRQNTREWQKLGKGLLEKFGKQDVYRAIELSR